MVSSVFKISPPSETKDTGRSRYKIQGHSKSDHLYQGFLYVSGIGLSQWRSPAETEGPKETIYLRLSFSKEYQTEQKVQCSRPSYKKQSPSGHCR